MHIKNRQRNKLLNTVLIMLVLCLPSIANAASDVWFANGDGTVTDVATGLIWQQEDDGVMRNHADAIAYCQNLSLAENTNWGLPNIKQLTSIVDYRSDSPAIDESAFLTTSVSYWSASDSASILSITLDSAYTVSFIFGRVDFISKASTRSVRCVR